MRKIIAFLGKLKPDAALMTYDIDGQRYEAKVFAQALYQYEIFDQMLVFVTDDAKESAWPVLAALQDDRIRPIRIPVGEDNQQMWDIFEIVIKHIEAGDELVFDITHGLRSLPFLSFLFSAYAKFAKKAEIRAVYYGALELTKNGITPVLDLSRFVQMFDWMNAASRFADLGDSRALSDLLRSEIPPHHELAVNTEARQLRKGLEKTAAELEKMSTALLLARPLEVLEKSADLSSRLKDAGISSHKAVLPFQTVKDKIITEYSQFAKGDDQWQNLSKQLRLVEWYVDRDYTIQAATLAREWVVSVLVFKFNRVMLNKDDRKAVEDALNNINHKESKASSERPSHDAEQVMGMLKGWPADLFNALINLWESLRNLRNDIAHVGMNDQEVTGNSLRGQMRKRLGELKFIHEQLSVATWQVAPSAHRAL
jgi:CRISPR-associated DxTHG motif protein